ncbi:hypothetical protein GCM10027442_47760 [Emticicia fontis]
MTYNTDDNCFNVYQNNSWQKLCGFDLQITDTWNKKADFGGAARFAAVGFSIGNKGYVGTGTDGWSNLKDFWEYDLLTDSWAQKADFGGVARGGAVGFSINTKGYIGTGHGNNNYQKDFWEYDPHTNIWTQKADLGGEGRINAVGFSIGNKGYIGTGRANDLLKDFWEYDPQTNKWLQKADFAGVIRLSTTGFSIGNRGYIGTGLDSDINAIKDFWEYNPDQDKWTQKADFAGSTRFRAFSFSIDNKGYIGGGYGSDISLQKDIWEYDPSSIFNGTDVDGNPKGNWIKKKDIGIGTIGNAVSFSMNGKGYVSTGLVGGNRSLSAGLWEYSMQESNLTQQGNNFNGFSQLVKTDSSGKIPASVLPDATLSADVTRQGNDFNQANQLTKLSTSGYLGIGMDSPKALIHLATTLKNKKIILWGEADNDHQFYGFGVNGGSLRYQVEHLEAAHIFYAAESTTSSKELFRINGNGSACLNGNIVSTGASCTSDIRYKRNLSYIANPLNKVMQLNGFHYYWKTEQFKEKNFPESRQIGFIAQEVEALFPELVITDAQGYKSVDYARLTPVLVEAIKELKKENDAIRKDVEALKNIVLQAQNGK